MRILKLRGSLRQIKRSALILGVVLGVSISTVPGANAGGLSVTSTTPITSSIVNVGQIWKGDIPTAISFSTDSYSEKMEFPITGILPYSVLADRAYGVSVEFAIWTDSGVKIGSESISSYEWNPIGPNTMVSFSLYPSANLYGTHTMIITTTYTTSTTGLLSRYLKDEKKIKITINKLIPKKIPDAPVIKVQQVGETLAVEFDPIQANPEVSNYQLTLSSLTSPGLPPTSLFNFGQRTIILEGATPKFILTKSEMLLYFNSGYATEGSPYILIRVEAINSEGRSALSNGVYVEPKELGLQIYSKAKSSPAASPQVSEETIKVPSMKKTITCVKGKTMKKVTAVKPSCPAGYKKK